MWFRTQSFLASVGQKNGYFTICHPSISLIKLPKDRTWDYESRFVTVIPQKKRNLFYFVGTVLRSKRDAKEQKGRCHFSSTSVLTEISTVKSFFQKQTLPDLYQIGLHTHLQVAFLTIS